MSELPANNSDWASYCELVQHLIVGNVRRNTFTRWEMDLLLDFQLVRLRKSARPELLRRYLKVVQRQMAVGAALPPSFSSFFENATAPRPITPALTDRVLLRKAS